MGVADFAWQDDAACLDATYEGRNPFVDPQNAMVSAELEWCARCPVSWECVQASREDPDGLWGGLRGVERVRFLRRYPQANRAARDAHGRVIAKLQREAVEYDREKHLRFRCNICERDVPKHAMTRNKRRAHGVGWYCKPCNRERSA